MFTISLFPPPRGCGQKCILPVSISNFSQVVKETDLSLIVNVGQGEAGIRVWFAKATNPSV